MVRMQIDMMSMAVRFKVMATEIMSAKVVLEQATLIVALLALHCWFRFLGRRLLLLLLGRRTQDHVLQSAASMAYDKRCHHVAMSVTERWCDDSSPTHLTHVSVPQRINCSVKTGKLMKNETNLNKPHIIG
uniref:Uncharacterized protein n=1 Tax=Anopheles epiroticus TaxID=199890 RepID=A0A182PQ27_9DIPT